MIQPDPAQDAARDQGSTGGDGCDSPEPDPGSIYDLLQHADWVRALARGLLNDSAMVDDVVQEVWAAALKNPPRNPDAAPGWLKSVVRHVSFRANRRQRLQKQAEHFEREHLEEVEREQPDDLAVRVETQKELMDAVLTLRGIPRQIVFLHYYEGLQLKEIAGRLQMNPSTVRTQLSRALERLRGQLTRWHGSRAAWGALLIPLLRPSDLQALMALSTVSPPPSLETALRPGSGGNPVSTGVQSPTVPTAASRSWPRAGLFIATGLFLLFTAGSFLLDRDGHTGGEDSQGTGTPGREGRRRDCQPLVAGLFVYSFSVQPPSLTPANKYNRDYERWQQKQHFNSNH